MEQPYKRFDEMEQYILKHNTKSAWARGVTKYASELLEKLFEDVQNGYFDLEDIDNPKMLQKKLLNGADNWEQYSWGGSALVCDFNIAERLCTPSELKKTKNGQRRPNSKEEWLDVQARALYQASRLVQIAANMTA